MKKLMAIFGATLLLAGVATSCSKVCECTLTDEVSGASVPLEEVNLKGTGFKNCNTYADYLNDNSIYGKVECKKK